ncbi:MAG TPA: DNA-binding response regulator [Firmicutes bacterium]|nr:DNA-binding response regulator [Bacillota bacterium]
MIEVTLALANHVCECAFDGETALNKIMSNHYDLIIMDIMLPKLDGFEIVEKMDNISVPIIFLSAKNDVPTIVRGLKSGIDYMTKPFEPLELLARVELRLGHHDDVYTYKDIKLDKKKREVYKNGYQVNLSPKEYELFLLFMENIDVVISKDEILNKIWGIYAEIETRTVDYHIGELRKKLDLKDDLITKSRVGYRLKGENHEI